MACLWETFAEQAELAEGVVHVWCANLEPGAEQVAVLQKTLSPSEKQRACSFRFGRHRRRFTVARGILRVLLGRYLGTAPLGVDISYSDYGKPYLPTKTIDFNVSHSEEFGLFAFCLGAEIGVDLEKIRPINDAEGIAARFFSEGEYQRLQQSPSDRRSEAFFACWTLKEAFIKAVGEGLSYGLSEFDVSFVPGQTAGLNSIHGREEEARQWSLHSLFPAPGYSAALAVKGQGWGLSQRQFPPIF